MLGSWGRLVELLSSASGTVRLLLWQNQATRIDRTRWSLLLVQVLFYEYMNCMNTTFLSLSISWERLTTLGSRSHHFDLTVSTYKLSNCAETRYNTPHNKTGNYVLLDRPLFGVKIMYILVQACKGEFLKHTAQSIKDKTKNHGIHETRKRFM